MTPEDRPPHVGRKMLLRAGLATLLIMCLSATAVAWAVIREVQKTRDIFAPPGRTIPTIPEIDAPDGGARTFMILGTDRRLGVDRDSPPRADTILLVRADPDKDTIGVLSIPRDLAVEIPGHGEDKINAAYDYGGKNGPRLVLRTVKKLFQDATGENFPVTNVMVMDYGGFRRAVDYIKGVYIDVDRDYFNDNSSGQNYATIDIDPGYQKLKGRDALDYVRYRHGDNDLVRAARQQDFLRQAQNASGVRSLLALEDRNHLARVFTRYFQVDDTFRSTKQIFSMLHLALYLAQKSPKVNEVRFRVHEAENPQVDSRLYTKKGWLRQMHREFMSTEGSATPRKGDTRPTRADREFEKVRKKRNKKRAGPVGGLEETAEGESMAVLADPKLKFPFYYPTARVTGSAYSGTEPRTYRLKDERGKRHQAYRLVLRAPGIGEYYGVQGMTWRAPPILDNPDDTVTYKKRDFQVYYDGSRLRLVAWKTKRAVYWVSNTLTQSIGEAQMLEIASSLERLNQ